MFFMKHKVVVIHSSNGETNTVSFVSEGEFQLMRRLIDAVRGAGAERFLEELEDEWEMVFKPAIAIGQSEAIECVDHCGNLFIEIDTIGVSSINTEFVDVKIDELEFSAIAYELYDEMESAGLSAADFFQALNRHHVLGTLEFPMDIDLNSGVTATLLQIES